MGTKLTKLGQKPSANWLALQKVGELFTFREREQILKVPQKISPHSPHPRKKRKLAHEPALDHHFKRGESSSPPTVAEYKQAAPESVVTFPTGAKNGESIDALRKMILGELKDQYTEHQKQYASLFRVSKIQTG